MKWVKALLALLALGILSNCAYSGYQTQEPTDVVIVALEYPEDSLHPGNLPWYRVADDATKACQKKGFDYALGTDDYTERCKYHSVVHQRDQSDHCSLYEFERVYRCKVN